MGIEMGGQFMDILTAINTRKSIRGYLPKAVPDSVIKEILEIALRTSSALNWQPWEITVITGEPLENIRRDNVAKVLSGEPGNSSSPRTGIYKQRQVELAIGLFKLMGIEREDKDKRKEWLLRGYRFFDAPAAIILSADKALHQTEAAFDVGAFAQTLCLAAMSYSIGTCIEEQVAQYPDVIRKHTGIPEDRNIIIGIALGYPDMDFPANQLQSQRASLEEVASWVGF
jgi:nitroreductase